MAQRPNKREDILTAARRLATAYLFSDTRHSTERRSEQLIPISEVRRVILTGTREKNRDRYDFEYFEDWTYAIRGKDLDGKWMRVIVAFVPHVHYNEKLAIVTSYYLTGWPWKREK